MSGRRSDLCALVAALCLWAGAAVAEAPGRVVSMNLCTDQMAMALAAPGQLVSISRISADPLSSPLSEAAAGYALNAGLAEEIYAFQPDLVLAGEYSDPVAVGLLRDLGVRVEQFLIVRSLDEIPGNLRRMGRLLGQEAAADALADGVAARLAEVAPAGAPRPVAAFFFANGYSLGPGTLAHDIVRRAGFDNLTEVLGYAGGARLSLEDLLMNAPDVLITAAGYPGASRSEAVMAHPVLEVLPQVIRGPEWVCGTQFTLAALDQMVAARRAMDEGAAARR